MKTKGLIIIFLLLFSILTIAKQANVDLAYSWLLNQPITNVFDASLATLALSRADFSAAQPHKEFIFSKKDQVNACWPAGNCNIKDTSLVLLIESKLGLGANMNTEDIINWLISKQTLANLPGEWKLQIRTPHTGTCSLIYTRQGELPSNQIELSVDQGKISYGSCQNKFFFSLNSCLGTNIVNKPSTKVDISCQSLTTADISLVYTEGNTIYLLGNSLPTRAQFTINNGFFGNKEYTLYANWALSEAQSTINSLIYLKKNAENKVFDQALLYLITKEQSFLNQLLTLQTNFGQFQDSGASSSEFNTGIASLALQESGQFTTELEHARDWLGEKQKQDGSWSSQVATTSMILYGAYQGGNIQAGAPSSQGVSIGNCKLTNPRWLNQQGTIISVARGSTNVPSGDIVLAAIDGSQECAGQRMTFYIFEEEQGEDPLKIVLGPIEFNAQEGFTFKEWNPPWFNDNPFSTVKDDPEYYFIVNSTKGSTSNRSFLLTVTEQPQTQCSDALDNDNDGKIDFPHDLGCLGFADLVEENSALACTDGWDNDNDGKIDLSDPGCVSITDNNETDGTCTPQWNCGSWSPCSSTGKQSRTCRDINGCGLLCPIGNTTCSLAVSYTHLTLPTTPYV